MSTTTMEQPTLGLKCDTPKAAPIVLTEKAAGEVKKIITDQVSAGETRALHLRQFVFDVSRLRLCAMTDPDHFARLGLPRRFALDLREVERQYLARSRD